MKNQKPYDSSDKKQVKAAKQNAYALEEKLQRGMTKIINDPDCMHVLRTFFEIAKPQVDPYKTDPHDHAHAAGWHGAGLWWFGNALLCDPSFYSKLLTDDGSLPIGNQTDDGHDEFNSGADDDSNHG